MRALITGGAGFIGTNLAKRLVKEGYHVTVIDDYSTGEFEENTLATLFTKKMMLPMY